MADEPQPQQTSSSNPVVFRIAIPWTTVQSAYQSRLQKAAEGITVDGFRPGKAPLPMVEERVGKKTLYSRVVEDILPRTYQDEVKKRAITPMISPRVKAISMEEQKDWEFEIAVVTKPSVELPGLEEKLRVALAPGKIVTLGKPEPSKDEKLRLALDAVLDSALVDLPVLLVEEEVNFRLSQLIDQVQAVGMTIEQYLSSKQLTADTLRQSYEKTARESLKLNLALDKIATDRGFTEKDRIAKAVDWLLAH